MKFNRNTVIKAAIAVVVLGAITGATPAFAASNTMISTLSTNWKSELKAIVPIVLLGISALGIIFAAWGTISAIMTKKQNQPLSWQLFAIWGGAAAVVIPLIVLAVSGSLVGSNTASQQFDDLGIQY